MLAHFLGLLEQSLYNTPSRVGSNWGGVVFTIVMFVIGSWFAQGTFVSQWKRHLGSAFCAAAVGWTGLLLISICLTVYDDHQNLVGAAHRIRKTYTGAISENQARISELKIACAKQEGETETLQTQNRDQQGTINGCLSQAIKLITPPPQLVKTFAIGTGMTNTPPGKPTSKAMVIVGITNHIITPIRATLECEYPIDSIAPPGLAGIPGGTSWQTAITRNRPSRNKIEAYIDSPPWRDGELLAFPVSSEEPGPGRCTITQAQ